LPRGAAVAPLVHAALWWRAAASVGIVAAMGPASCESREDPRHMNGPKTPLPWC